MNGLFVTGTDTDIGKTALSALLLAELRRRGINAAPMKPAQTGCKPADSRQQATGTSDPSCLVPNASCLSVPDLDYSLSMAAMEVDSETYQTMSPYRFEPACSPHLAAEMAGTEIDIAEMVIAARTLTSDYGFVIAEGAGGTLVPLNQRETMLDLMQALKLPVLIAARPGLGTINHTLLTIRTLRADGLDIAGVVFIASTDDKPGFIESDNINTIEHFGKVPILGTIPYCAQLTPPKPNYDDLPIPVVAEVEKIVNQLGI
ncbi:MAG: dethiobiotin synthase [Verrucomicrobiota bacterium]